MIAVKGTDIRAGQPGCGHWRTERDVVAIKFPCCGEFYACHDCHTVCADHPPEIWPQDSWASEKAILCRACNTVLTIADYMAADSICPHCGAAFNPGCKNHWHLYFDTENPA